MVELTALTMFSLAFVASLGWMFGVFIWTLGLQLIQTILFGRKQ